jgi:hypothetical protein
MKPTHVRETVLDLSYYRDWVAKREADRQKDAQKRTYFISLSREYGCQGYDVATALLDKLNAREDTGGWSLFTHQNLEEMAGSPELGAEMIHDVMEHRWSFQDWFVDSLVPKYMQSYSSKTFERMRNLTLNLADKGNVIFLGGGAQVITHRLDPKKFCGLHFRIIASDPWRIHQVEEIFDLPRDKAEGQIDELQDARNKFIKDFTGFDVNDPALYHVWFNNAKNNPEEMSEMIIRYLGLQGAFGE